MSNRIPSFKTIANEDAQHIFDLYEQYRKTGHSQAADSLMEYARVEDQYKYTLANQTSLEQRLQELSKTQQSYGKEIQTLTQQLDKEKEQSNRLKDLRTESAQKYQRKITAVKISETLKSGGRALERTAFKIALGTAIGAAFKSLPLGPFSGLAASKATTLVIGKAVIKKGPKKEEKKIDPMLTQEVSTALDLPLKKRKFKLPGLK